MNKWILASILSFISQILVCLFLINYSNSLLSTVSLWFMLSLVLTTIVITYGQKAFISSRLPALSLNFILLIGLINFLLWPLGFFLTWLMIYSYLYYFDKLFNKFVLVIDKEPLQVHDIHTAHYGASGAWHILKNKSQSVQDRMSALLKMCDQPSPLTNYLIKELLPEHQDEIRLLAFSLLEKQGSYLYSLLETLNQKNQSQLNDFMIGKLEKKRAEIYWELFYQKLIQPELTEMILDKALKAARESIQKNPKDYLLIVLMGKIYLAMKNYHESEHHFLLALHDKSLAVHIVPYLAEIYFNLKQYANLVKLLNTYPELRCLPFIKSIYSLWI